MQTKHYFIAAVLSVIGLFSFQPKTNDLKVKEYLGVPGPIDFNKATFSLSWSSHPNKDYFKQEYLPSGEKSETFNKMFMIEALVGDLTPKDAMANKIKELDERKKTDAVTNYQFIQNPKTGEYILDFVISSGNIVEWNAYRYTSLKDGSNKGLVLFAYSKRAYGAATTSFLKNLKTTRPADINSLATYATPAIKIKAE